MNSLPFLLNSIIFRPLIGKIFIYLFLFMNLFILVYLLISIIIFIIVNVIIIINCINIY